jgi:hypothetical protein
VIHPLLVLKTRACLYRLHGVLAGRTVLGGAEAGEVEALELVRVVLDCWESLLEDPYRDGPDALSHLGLAVRMLDNEERYCHTGEQPVTALENDLHRRFLAWGDRVEWEIPRAAFHVLEAQYWPGATCCKIPTKE